MAHEQQKKIHGIWITCQHCRLHPVAKIWRAIRKYHTQLLVQSDGRPGRVEFYHVRSARAEEEQHFISRYCLDVSHPLVWIGLACQTAGGSARGWEEGMTCPLESIPCSAGSWQLQLSSRPSVCTLVTVLLALVFMPMTILSCSYQTSSQKKQCFFKLQSPCQLDLNAAFPVESTHPNNYKIPHQILKWHFLTNDKFMISRICVKGLHIGQCSRSKKFTEKCNENWFLHCVIRAQRHDALFLHIHAVK